MEMLKTGSPESVVSAEVSTSRLVKEIVYGIAFFTSIFAVMIPWIYFLCQSAVSLIHRLFS